MTESNDTINIPKLVSEYLARFPYVYKIPKNCENYDDIKLWCEKTFNHEFKDWFWFPGGRYDDHCNLHIVHEKWNTLFVLRWGDKI